MVHSIDVASYGALGHAPTSTSNSLIFHVTSEPHSGCLPRKSMQAYSFVTVYCTNFIIILCVTLKNYFLLVLCPSLHQIMATPLVHSLLHLSSDIILGSTKIIFEVSSLANVSPQTISCCSVVHCSSDTVTWKCLVDSWGQTAADRWSMHLTTYATADL